MSKRQDLGPISAYALAVEHGYQGTEEEWVAAVEYARLDAKRMAEAAEEAKRATEASASAAEAAKVGAATAANAAKTAQDKAEEASRQASASAAAAAASEEKSAAAQVEVQTALENAESAKRGAETARDQSEAAQVEAEKAKAAANEAAAAARDHAASASAFADDSKASAEKSEKYYNRLVRDDQTKIKTDVLFRFPRTGKIYTVKIPKYAANQATTCEKLDDNAGLVCEPSTDTVEGRDDYADIPLFRWYNCNYLREENGHAYPTAIEGLDDAYTAEGNVDVGVIQMAPYIKWDESNEGYTLLSITDSPREGYTLWSTARYGDETFPYVIHSKYFSGTGPDGMPRSLPGLVPRRKQSHNSQIGDYGKKGTGYTGARAERNTWQIVFELIKYPHKSAQIVFAGCTNYSFQYPAAVQRAGNDTYFPVTKAQAANIIVGSRVSVGYGAVASGALTTDRGYDSIHKYADEAKVLRVEPIADNISAVYLDVESGFPTAKVALSDAITSDVYISSMHWHSGVTDGVIGHHDGTPVSNTDGKRPYRVQGVEYAVGGYFVASDTVFQFEDAAGAKFLRACPDGVAHSSNEATIKAQYMEVGSIPAGDYWVGDISIDPDTCVSWPSAKGGGSAVGVGDYLYGGGTPTAGTLRELLIGGYLGNGSYAGPSYAGAWYWLGSGDWTCLAAD